MIIQWEKMETRSLCYGSWETSGSTIKATIFGLLIELAEGRMTNYRSDLWHDARWIDEYVTGPMEIQWVLRDWGTHIGESAATYNYGNFGGNAWKYKFELEDNDGKWNLTIYEGSPVQELPNVPDTMPKFHVITDEEKQAMVDAIFPIHGNVVNNTKGNNMSYDLERLLDGLREKLDEANSTKDDLEEKQSSIEDAVGELENYIDEMERIIGSLDELPEVSIYVDLDTVSFDS